MQKKIIALAVAALASSAAFAQSNVTVYGTVDLGQAWVKSNDSAAGAQGQKNVGRLDNNSSNIGFRGTEDLGNGLKALFQFEAGINTDTNGGWGGGRDTYIGLTGGFGTFVAGNLTHPLRAMGSKVEILPGAAGFGTVNSITGAIGTTKTGADDRAQNALAYVSPKFGGFNATVAYVNGEVNPNGAGQGEARQWQVAGQYEDGPLYVGAGYHKVQNGSPVGTAGNVEADAAVWRLAATYSFPTNTKVTALYDNTKAETNVAGAYFKRAAYSLGVMQSFGQAAVGLEWAKSNKIKTEAGTVADSSANIWTLVGTYSLSKRTTAHARYSKLSNNAGADYRFYYNPVAAAAPAAAGRDYTGFMVGLRHSF
ncbi:porin [Azonexus hydrophilus]|uniref:Porin n=1 Tax=Azonexus hydrophilus TaxID=418702 RepID=A0ABZ2XFN5_9RHOO